MTTLTITPNWKNKTARFKGTIAAGEHVAVHIANDDEYITDTTNIRLRVVNPANGRTLAQFPMPPLPDVAVVENGSGEEVAPSDAAPDEWDTDITPLSCELNLNTVQMLMFVPPAANMPLLFVLDDYEGKTLYFKDTCEVTHWPRRRGEEEPVNLDDYKDIIAKFREDIYGEGGFNDRVESAEQAATAAETIASTVSGGLSAEIERASAAERALAVSKADLVNGKVPASQLPSIGVKFIRVDVLPSVDTADEQAIYLVPSAESETGNIYDEYIAVETAGGVKAWELIGSTAVDLSDYYDKTAADGRFVQKETGKGLSSNDYTTTEKQKLAGVEAGAQVNAVASVNGKTGEVVLGASDVGAAGTAIFQRFESNTDFVLILERFDNNGNILYVTEGGTGGDGPFIFNTSQYQSSTPEYRPCVIFGGPHGATLAYLNDIAPQFSTSTAYAPDDLVVYAPTKGSYLYRCTEAHTGAWNSDHFTRATVKDVLTALRGKFADYLPRTGGTMTGNLVFRDMSEYRHVWEFENGIGGDIRLDTYNSSGVKVGSIYIPAYVTGTLALLQNLADNYSTSATYAVNNLCVYNNQLYRCTTAITTAEAWTAAHWTEATVEDVLAALRAAVASKAPLASPAFTGTPTAPTPASGDDSTKVATTAFVQAAVAGGGGGGGIPDFVLYIDEQTGNICYKTPDVESES